MVEGGPEHLILRDGRAVGVVSTVEEEQAVVHEALVERGYGVVAPAGEAESGEPVYELEDECTEDEPRPCELAVALGFAQVLAEQCEVSAAEVQDLERRGEATDAEVEAAVRAVVGRLPEDCVPQGQALLEVAGFEESTEP